MKLPSGRWNLRWRQSLLTAVLAAPLFFAIATAPPFAAEPRAQGTTNMVGPMNPVRAGGVSIVPTRSGNNITISSPWTCGSSTINIITLSNQVGGQFRTASRENGLRHQAATITGFTGGFPTTFALSEQIAGATVSSTNVSLIDGNSDGVPDGAMISGAVNATTSFVYTPNSDFVSIPWSQASALNIDTTTTCAGVVSQVWIPLADTNGDGRGDSIVFDLDGNGVADADVFSGPPVVIPSVPAMGPIARLILMLLIGLSGAWFLSRRQNTAAGTPA